MVFYIDAYFLINFTVDFLALYFAVRLSKVKTTFFRLFALCTLGATIAVFEVLASANVTVMLLLGFALFLFVSVLVPKSATPFRRIRCSVLFFIFELLIGGVVSHGYSLFDRYLYKELSKLESSSPNRKLLILALFILLSVGVFKLLSLVFSGTVSERSVEIQLEFGGSKITVEALVDTANLLKEPMSGRPILLIKEEKAALLAPGVPTSLDKMVKADGRFSAKVFLVPITTSGGSKMLVGFRPDKITVLGKKNYEVDAALAIDTERGTYGGFSALMPAAALE